MEKQMNRGMDLENVINYYLNGRTHYKGADHNIKNEERYFDCRAFLYVICTREVFYNDLENKYTMEQIEKFNYFVQNFLSLNYPSKEDAQMCRKCIDFLYEIMPEEAKKLK